MRTEFVKGMQSGGPPVVGTVMMCGRVMFFKKRYPAAALAACRELIREAEGACLGLRVTLTSHLKQNWCWAEEVKKGRTRLWFASKPSW